VVLRDECHGEEGGAVADGDAQLTSLVPASLLRPDGRGSECKDDGAPRCPVQSFFAAAVALLRSWAS
jgi:hypothetical protein